MLIFLYHAILYLQAFAPTVPAAWKAFVCPYCVGSLAFFQDYMKRDLSCGTSPISPLVISTGPFQYLYANIWCITAYFFCV